MEEYDYRVSAILTEHFGYPPLTVIDDVINAVNHILYKCTQAMELYLKEQRHKDEEISIGTGKLETLLENQVDKNFDKFELYALRNIFTVPLDLIDEGWFRLKHHENLDFKRLLVTKDDHAINKIIKDIKLELKLREILKLQVDKAQTLVGLLKKYSSNLKYLNDQEINNNLLEKSREILLDLSPIDDNLYFILQQVNILMEQTNKLYVKFEKNKVNMDFTPSLRDFYMNGKSFKLLQSIGIHIEPELKDLLKSVTIDDADV